MTGIELISAHVPAALLTLARLSGLFVFAPVLSSPIIPGRVKALLVCILTLAVYPTLHPSQLGSAPPIPPHGPSASDVFFANADVFTLGFSIVGEVLLGLCIGLLASLPLYAVQLAGMVMGQQVGFGLGAVYNPALDSDGDVLSQLMLMVAIGVYIAVGGVEAVFTCCVDSFSRVPLGGWTSELTPLGLCTGLVGAGFELALRVAAPVLGIIMLETVASGTLMKTIPQVNILTVGFAVKIVLALGVLVFAVGAIDAAIGDEVLRTFGFIGEWVNQLGGAPAAGRGA